MNSGLFTLILLHITGSVTLDLSVSCSENVCGVKGYQATLDCSYAYNDNIKTVFWFSQKQSINWKKNSEPEDVTLDSDYSGRVTHQIKHSSYYSYSTLTISDVRERDSGEYQLMFIMKDGAKHLSSAAVNLTVTGLQVRVNPPSTDLTIKKVELTCDSSCTSGVGYYWRKDGRYLTNTDSSNMFVSVTTEPNKYSCFLNFNLKQLSPYVCVSKDQCWGVTYTSRRVCALVGSTVDFSCTYSHPSGYTVMKTFWHYVQPGDFKDLHEELQFAGRVEYEENKLRIKELKMNDSGEYRFRFITDKTDGKYSGSPGVILTVTDTEVLSSPDIISGRGKVILSCSTKCTLDNKHTYIWYKNGRLVTDGFTKLNKLYLDSVSSEELQEYSCAVREEIRALRNTAVILCVILVLALIGVLCYRWRIYNSSKTPRFEKEEVQYETVHINATSSELMQKTDADNQEIHYSSISFKTKQTSLIPTDSEDPANSSETEDVHYAAIRFK